MSFYKGTKQECLNYIAEVNQGESYIGVTSSWAEPIERNGEWYVPIAQPPYTGVKYSSAMQETELPEPIITLLNQNYV